MKKFLLILLVFFLSLQFSYSQGLMITFDSALNALMGMSTIEQLLHYGQVIKEYAQTALRWEQQIHQWKTEAERYAKALSSFSNIKDYSSFMDWYNRALQQEQYMMNSFTNPNIQIGSRRYSWADLDKIGTDLYSDWAWNSEFTEDQRREMWLKLGLTPANYAYIAPYRMRANEAAKEALTAKGWQDAWMARNLEQTLIRQTALAEDRNKTKESDKLTEKEVAMMMAETLNEQNVTLNEIARMQALQLEIQAVDRKLNNSPAGIPPVLNNTPKNVFRPLDDPLKGLD